jgi:biopolymer transport protein ExbB
MILAGAIVPSLAGAAEAADAGLNTFQDVIEAGGWPMQVIIIMSIIALFLVFYFIFTLRAQAIFPSALLREAEDAAAEGDIEALEAICQGNNSAAAKIIYAAAEHVQRDPRADYSIIRDAVEDEGARQAGMLWQRIQYLMDIAMVAPMVGLLGTVLGMLHSFAKLRTAVGGVMPTSLAQGVSQALITTAGGLIVGILATILYALFRGRVNTLVSGLESSCNRVLRQFVSSQAQK